MFLLIDLIFIGSVATVLVLLIRLVFAGKKRAAAARHLGGFLVAYAAVLVTVSLATPRRIQPPGKRKCFDDWCVTLLKVEPGTGPQLWTAQIEVFSDAKRVSQAAPDAVAKMEGPDGRLYDAVPSSESGPHLTDRLNPGERLTVDLAYRLPPGVTPKGVQIWHGRIPGLIAIASDYAWLHQPMLFTY